MENRNVLFIIADEFRADCLGAAGNHVIQTPNLDALAHESALFEKCFVQATPCGPSRMCIYTGRYLCAHNSVDNMTPLMDAEDNLAHHLRRHGHAPGFIGYNDYAMDPAILPEGHPHRTGLCYDYFLPGFDVVLDHEYDSKEWYEDLRRKGYPPEMCCHEIMYYPNVPPEGPGEHLPEYYPAHYRAEDSEAQFVTSRAIDYCTERRGRGWFLSLNYIKPHGPNLCPAPYHDLYRHADLPTPYRCADELEGRHPYLSRFYTNACDQLVSERELREFQACYYGMITELDACLGRLFQALKDSGQWDHTLIIFTSDHGEHLGDHYLTGKAHYFDGNMRVPYLLRDPSPNADATRGKKLDVFCEAIDSAPTICAFLGVPPQERCQGESLLGLVRGDPNAAAKPRIFHEFYYYNSLKESERNQCNPAACRLWVVRDDDYKYVQFGEEFLDPLLFDLKTDPGEMNNLAGRPEYAATVARYAQHLIRWRIRNEDLRMEHWARQYR